MRTTLSPVLASLANVFRIPLSQTASRPAAAAALTRLNGSNSSSSSNSPSLSTTTNRQFSTTSAMAKRKHAGPSRDKRVTMIRYFLHHPLTPRPLRFSRTRFLRHWTIHRAWHLYQAQRRRAETLELERQWQAMRAACEELRTGAGDGGKLFRKSMIKTGIFKDLFPIEYARLQTEGPPAEGWNHEWKAL
ncbi:mitochondrial 54S ribosomal protein mL40, partial [Aspergillus aculeatinus CBS 121060]